MGTHKTSGFTIIETMLVLAITGALVAGLFVGIGTSINAQRYRDAVETFKLTLQTQYAELSSVINSRDDNWVCDGQASTEASGVVVRGQSDCLLIGRLVTVNQSDISIYTVLGREQSTPDIDDNDIERLRTNYALNISNVEAERTTLEWGTQIAWPVEGAGSRGNGQPTTPRSLSILYVRSPDSGQMYTFSNSDAPDEVTGAYLQSMLVEGNAVPGQGERIVCINSNGFFVGDDRSVVIGRFAAVPSAIETSTNEIIANEGRDTRC